MFITDDNPAHSDLCGVFQLNAVRFCRKCYFVKLRKQAKKKLLLNVKSLPTKLCKDISLD